jgi:tRNA dimethylallyltransferase
MKAAPVVVIGGPTASGKSAVALALARRLGGTVINADSIQLYRELQVLSDRPPSDTIDGVPHRLYGILPAAAPCSAAAWRTLALAEIDAARGAGRLPIVAGGTGLYLKALLHGLSPVPEIPDTIRRDVRARLAAEGPEAIHAVLAARDPETAARLRPSDPQRLARALEVLEATGRSLTAWQRLPGTAPPGLRFACFVLMPERETLYAACDGRWARMTAAGALEEARRLAGLGLDPRLPAMKALGLRPLLRQLEGEIDGAEADRLARQETRRYAKRQTTWFRHQLPEAVRISPSATGVGEAIIEDFIAKIALNAFKN